MKKEVINVLIEQCLQNTSGRLDKNYVEKVATSWIRQGIDSFEKAQNAQQPATGKKEPRITKKDMEMEDVDIEELRRRMFGEK